VNWQEEETGPVAQKTVCPGDLLGTTFNYTGDVAGQARDGQRLIQGGLEAGTYSSQQLVPDGWVLASITCDDADSTGDVATATATFRLQAG
jgi:hypothetical protein